MSISNAPLVSIIIPLHNKASFIRETWDSLQSQTFQDWECLIVENRSTDNSLEVAQQIRDPRLQILITEAQGPCSARNQGLRQARGKWILFLDADDLLPPNYLQSKMKLIQEQPGRDLYSCPWEEQNPQGKTERHDPLGSHVSREEMLASAFIYPPFAIHTTLIRREMITPELEWPESLDQGLCEDAIFWFKLLHQGGIAFHDDTYAIYRTQTENFRNQVKNLPRLSQSYEKIIKANLQYLQDRNLKPTPRQAYYLYTFYQKMEREAASENLESIQKNARLNLNQIFPQLSPWDQLKIKFKKWIFPKSF